MNVLALRLTLLWLCTIAVQCAFHRAPIPAGQVELRGVIRDPEGEPVEGIEVVLDPADDAPRGGSWSGEAVRTDPRGKYRIWLKPGPYRLVLYARKLRVPYADLDTIHLTKAVTRFDHTYAGAKVSGVVTGPEGRPVSSGVIMAVGSETGSRREVDVLARVHNGKFAFFLRPGEFGIKSDSLPPGLPMASWLDLRVSGDTTLHIDASGHRVSGRVLLGSDTPLAAATIIAMAYAGGTSRRAETVTANDGSYEAFLPSGSYGLVVRPGPSQSFISSKTIERDIRGPGRLDIDMSGVEWRGTVRDSAGALVDSVVVGAYYGSPRRWAEDVTRDGGRFRLIVQSWGTYSVVVMKSDRRTQLGEWSGIPARSDSTLNLVLGR